MCKTAQNRSVPAVILAITQEGDYHVDNSIGTYCFERVCEHCFGALHD